MTYFNSSLNKTLNHELNKLKLEFSLENIDITYLKKPLTIDFYKNWLSLGYQGTMNYLSEHLPLKEDPHQLSSELKSVISISQSYFPAVAPHQTKIPARTALYSQNEDYHIWLKSKLIKIIDQLRIQFPKDLFLPYVDSGPILERDLAYQNKLGWFGKNTCIIHPKHGSLFFIAEIFTSISYEPEPTQIELIPDHCGTCQRCIDICPTQAITSPKTLKADQCISYLTIESKESPPLHLRSKIGDWFFGCDLCQTVCPWNEKIFRTKQIPKTSKTDTTPLLNLNAADKSELINYFIFLFTASNKQIQKYHQGSPLLRAGARGLKRNALIVTANQKIIELKPYLKKITEPKLLELVQWTEEQLN